MTRTPERPPTRRDANDAFARARDETVRYHEEFYASAAVGEAGTWLAEPHQLMVDALERLPHRRMVTAYDLGAGIGRHTLPMLSRLPTGSEVYAVDLLQSALDRISSVAVPEGGTTLHTVQCDLADFSFPTPADFVIAFSAIEHLPGERAIRVLLERIRAALNPEGVVAVGIIADRFEVREDGTSRGALLESGLSAATAGHLLEDVFDAFRVDYLRSTLAEVDEERDGEPYTLRSTLVTFLATKHQ